MDKKIRDHVDNKSIALYNFTKARIELLKYSRISKIRFSIMGGIEKTRHLPPIIAKFSYSYGSDNKNYHETDVEISTVFSDRKKLWKTKRQGKQY